jgi:hypothetical protein
MQLLVSLDHRDKTVNQLLLLDCIVSSLTIPWQLSLRCEPSLIAITWFLAHRLICLTYFFPTCVSNSRVIFNQLVPRQVEIFQHSVVLKRVNQGNIAFGFDLIPRNIEVGKSLTFFKNMPQLNHLLVCDVCVD